LAAHEQTLGRYRLVSLIGEGGMGKVYKAFDSSLERSVAIKILPADVVRDPARVARFMQEARAASALNHPHVMTVYDIGEEKLEGEAESTRFIAMELIEGSTLRELINREQMDLRRGLKIAMQVAEGLAAAHAAGIVHRDLKPENVMVNQAGFAKILDFGLAKLRILDDADGGADKSRTIAKASEPGTVMGTVGYMSPEQARGLPVDQRSDVFSLGCVLYEIATGRRAFRGDSSVDTMHKIIYSDPDPIRTLRQDLPPELARIVRKSLAKDADERYQSAKEVAIDLRDLLREIDSNPSGASFPGVIAAAPPARKSPWVFVAVGALVLAAVAMTFVFRSRRPAAAARSASAMRITRITANGKVIAAVISPDAKYVAYVVSEQGQQALAVRQMATGQTLTLIPNRRTAYWGMAFTPDSSSIYFAIKDSSTPAGAMYQISALGGAPRKIIDDIDSQPTFSPDGTQMAFMRAKHPAQDQSAVIVAKSDGTAAHVLAKVTTPEYFVPIFFAGASWSPDGKLIATTVLDRPARSARLVAIDTATGAMRTIAAPPWKFAAQVAWLPDGKGLVTIARGNGWQETGQVWYVPYPTGEPQQITNDLFDYRIVSLSGDGKSLVTVGSYTATDMWLLPDGGAPRRIEGSKQEALYGVDPLPDGRLLTTSIETGKFDIWLVNEEGTGRTLLTHDENVNRYPVVTPDLKSIVYHSQTTNANEICRMNLDGSGRTVLARTGLPGAVPAVSPDGKWLVYEDFVPSADATRSSGLLGLMRVPMSGGTPQKVSGEWLARPAFSPDGTKLAVTLNDRSSSRFFVAVLPAEGGPVTRISEFAVTASSAVKWSDDGSSLIVNTAPNDRANLWMVPLDGAPWRRMTNFDERTLFSFARLRKGKGWAISRGDLSRDAVIITGFRPQQ
jgi:Tol biopolymer transport system component